MKSRKVRIVAGIPLLVVLAGLSPASAQVAVPSSMQATQYALPASRVPAAREARHAPSRDTRAVPSTLDYVVLASLADASNLLSMTNYRSPASGMPTEQSAPGVAAPSLGE